MNLLAEAKERAHQWLNSTIVDEHSKKEINRLLSQHDPKELIDSFYKNLEFGTGGLRGIMGVGSNCINKYTIGIATQGLSNYLIKSFASPVKVVIGYDSRNNSKSFAQLAADVFSANGIEVYFFPELRPTPLLSFAIRYLKCQSGVVITASHNPKEYNGYKAYWADGAQLVPPHDKNVISEVNAITRFEDVKFEGDPSKIKFIGKEIEDAYYQEVAKVLPEKEAIQKFHDISIVYSSIHGAGITMVPECLKRLGFTNVNIVEEQMKPDGNFPTVHSPNPEEQSAMEMALTKAKKLNADLVMATDPDTDRVGIGIKNNNGEFFLLNGNQALSLMMWFILKNAKDPGGSYIAKTIVTSELIDEMSASFGIQCFNTLTGFKYIAELMREMEGQKKFLMAGEESYGYMVGDFVRDKDAVSACAFFAAMSAKAKTEKKSLFDWLLEMYIQFGYYREGLVNLVRKGADGEQQIKSMMEGFRNNPPSHIAGERVVRILDYLKREDISPETGKKIALTLPKSDVLQFYTDAGSKISARPSGTEPKIKFYISLRQTLSSKSDFDKITKELEQKIKSIEHDFIK